MRPVFLNTVFLFFLAGCLFAGEWQVDKDAASNVTFTSTTTLLDFNGSTSAIDGYYYNDGDSLFDGKNELYFEVRLATFETGISKRDRDMREDVLETDDFPLAKFKGQVVKYEKTANGYHITVEGEMTLHGHSKKMTITADLKTSENSIIVASKFSVFLKDYQIEAPSLLAFVKVAEEIKLDLNFTLKKVK